MLLLVVFCRSNVPEADPGRPNVPQVAAGVGGTLAVSFSAGLAPAPQPACRVLADMQGMCAHKQLGKTAPPDSTAVAPAQSPL